ncbi:MAG: translation initiation factor [Planctomycetales bacterium]
MRLFAGTVFDRPPLCDRCGKVEADCGCPALPPAKPQVPAQQQTARLTVEKRRKGKIVTVVQGLAASANDLPGLLKKLKNHCGAGGTLDGDSLEIQGDHRDRLQKLLGEMGYKVRV